MHVDKKAQTRLIIEVTVGVAIILISLWFAYSYLAKRGPEAVEKIGFKPLEDADADSIRNAVDKCCAPACNPLNFGNRPVEQFGELIGCIKDVQGPTTCDAPACNPPPATGPAVAGTPAPSSRG